jgi:hypothetical protein
MCKCRARIVPSDKRKTFFQIEFFITKDLQADSLEDMMLGALTFGNQKKLERN